MKLFYYKSRDGNFGDDLNSWLWERLLPGRWSEDDGVLFSGIGTIIGNPMPPADRVVIFSSGFGYSPVPVDWRTSKWKVSAVRGYLSAQLLGLPDEDVVADGALLLSKLPDFSPLAECHRHGTLFVPHHTIAGNPGLRQAAEWAGLEYLDPRGHSEVVIRRLQSAELVIADSMHAAIIADVFRVPWLPVATSSSISSFKWMDWASALRVPYEPTRIPSPSLGAAYKSWSQSLYGEAHFVTRPSAEAVLEQVRRVVNQDFEKMQGRRRSFGRAARIARAVPGLKHLSGWYDHRAVEAAATSLMKLAQQRGFLSDQSTSSALADELHYRLQQL